MVYIPLDTTSNLCYDIPIMTSSLPSVPCWLSQETRPYRRHLVAHLRREQPPPLESKGLLKISLDILTNLWYDVYRTVDLPA